MTRNRSFILFTGALALGASLAAPWDALGQRPHGGGPGPRSRPGLERRMPEQRPGGPGERRRQGRPGALQPGGPGAFRPAGRGAMIASALETVGVTPEQRRQFHTIRQRHDGRMRAIGRRLIETQREMEDHLFGPTPNPERARAAAQERVVLLSERERARTDVELEVFRSLTPEQRASLRELRAQRRQRPDAGARRQGPAQGGRRMGPPPEGIRRPGGRHDRQPLLELGLSADQMTRLREIRRQRGPGLRELNRRLRETQRRIDDALLADAVDEGAVRALAGELGRLEAERLMVHFEMEVAIRSLLTPEQAVRLRELRRRGPGAPPSRAPEGAPPGEQDSKPPALDSPEGPVF